MMVSNLLLITSTTALISLLLIIRMHYAQVGKIASFLLAIGLMTLRIIFITALSMLGISISKYIFITHVMTSLIFFPLIHVHFRQLTEIRGWKKTDLLHGLPLLACFSVLPFLRIEYPRLEVLIIGLVLLFYWAMILQSFRKGIWNRHSQVSMVMKNIRQIRGLSNIFFVIISIGLAYNLGVVIYFLPTNESLSLNHLILPSLLLLSGSIKLLLNPDIISGFDIVPMVVRKSRNNTGFMDIWCFELEKEVVGKRDQSISDKVGNSLKEYIRRIEVVSLETKLFRKQGVTLDEFAAELKIPAFHVAYVFRYHSRENFQDFKKIIQINDAIELMKAGYVKQQTIESLALTVGFSSYNPFFLSFKNITGITPQQYSKSMES